MASFGFLVFSVLGALIVLGALGVLSALRIQFFIPLGILGVWRFGVLGVIPLPTGPLVPLMPDWF